MAAARTGAGNAAGPLFLAFVILAETGDTQRDWGGCAGSPWPANGSEHEEGSPL